MPTKSREHAKHDVPARIQTQPFSSDGDFRATGIGRLRVSQPPRLLPARQIHPLVLHPLPAHRRGNWLGHVPLLTLIAIDWHHDLRPWQGTDPPTHPCMCRRSSLCTSIGRTLSLQIAAFKSPWICRKRRPSFRKCPPTFTAWFGSFVWRKKNPSATHTNR